MALCIYMARLGSEVLGVELVSGSSLAFSEDFLFEQSGSGFLFFLFFFFFFFAQISISKF